MSRRLAAWSLSSWSPWVPPLAALIVHASYVPRGFTWLDHGDVAAGRAVLPLARVYEAFSTRMGDTGFFRPMVVLLHSLDHAVYGTWAPGHHLTSVLLYVSIVVVAPLFLRAFVRLSAYEECVAALVVAVHPLSWLLVGGITYQQELLVTLFALVAVAAHARARRTGACAVAVVAVAGTLLAVLSKETAFFWLPALIGLWEMLERGPASAFVPRLWLAHASAWSLGLLARARAVPEVWRSIAEPLSLPDWIGVRVRAVARGLLELLSPGLPSLNDSALTAPPGPRESLIVLAGLGAAMILLRPGLASPPARLVLVLGVTFAPALRLVPVSRFGSPHYTFPAVVVLGALIALAWRALAPHATWARAAMGAFAAWLLIAGGSTFAGGARFADDAALFAPEVQSDPAYLEAHAELGRHWLARGNAERAREHLEKALRPRPRTIAYLDRSMAHVNYALALAALQRLDQAERELAQARNAAPPSRLWLIDYNQALVAARAQRDAQVVALLTKHQGTWTSPEPGLVLARSLGRLGRFPEARAALERAERVASAEQRRVIEALRFSMPRH